MNMEMTDMDVAVKGLGKFCGCQCSEVFVLDPKPPASDSSTEQEKKNK